MRVLIAMDSLKGCLSSPAAGTALKTGILRAMPEADVRVCPLADGGEGTMEALTYGLGGDLQEVTVTGPLGTPVRARYGILPDGVTAVMEMSAAAGITAAMSSISAAAMENMRFTWVLSPQTVCRMSLSR